MVEPEGRKKPGAGAPGGLRGIQLRRLASAIDARLIGVPEDLACAGVSIDSRTLQGGELFWALAGTRTDGHRFVRQAVARGARAAVVSKPLKGAAPPLLLVQDTRRALLEAGRWYRRVLSTVTIAVTGSVGKTTTREMLRCVLGVAYDVHSAERSFNNDLGVPLTILNCPKGCEVLLAELGTSSPGEIADLTQVVDPDVALVTAIGPAHLSGLGTLEGVAREKLSMLWHSRAGALRIVNADALPRGGWLRQLPRDLVRYSLRGLRDENTICGRWIADPESPRLIVGRSVFRLSAFGKPIAYAALAAVLVARELGLSDRRIQAGLNEFAPLEGRSCLWDCGDMLVLDDTYNANPLSVRSCVETIAAWARRRNWQAVLVLGDLLELGQEEERLLRELGESLGSSLTCLVAVGSRAALVAEGAVRAGKTQVYVAPSADEAARFVLEQYGTGTVIGVKGSRAARMERVVQRLLERSGGSREAA